LIFNDLFRFHIILLIYCFRALGLMFSDYLPLFFKVLENEKWQKTLL